jgi:hypothetical protein
LFDFLYVLQTFRAIQANIVIFVLMFQKAGVAGICFHNPPLGFVVISKESQIMVSHRALYCIF